ncbi:sugar transferase [Bacillus sp. Au-Bac7]|uniref:sugar transferase n=1 Tax=Bacillus sp. Au-Bac7 TaxID=2906458 RepID=UPI001E36BC73|nr:sugar transferase [Bacillus sp. Au-Bac7]MCE4049562.1 sugar transferase [Bacillus sp. Au-Bac7]
MREQKAYLITKRFIDVVSSIFGLLVLSPLIIIIAILIKLEDPKGPILFRQIRIGKDEKEFYMYKFRSMVSNAEELKASLLEQNEADGPVFKMKNDPRITKIGKFIRKTSIDELPQLLNVLIGDMSLVGPRPPLPNEVALYGSYEKQRLKVTPGLTCYWQVSGRSNIGFDEWILLDIKYINERNTYLDIKLIIRTFFVLFGSRDAY